MCRILAACAETQVTELKFGDLCVFFGTPAKKVVVEGSHPEPAAEIAEIQTRLKEIEEEALEEDERNLKEEQLALMRIENPYEAERLLLEGSLDLDGLPDGDDGEERA